MRACLLLAAILLLDALPLAAQTPEKNRYEIAFNSDRDVYLTTEQNVLYVNLRFVVVRQGDGAADDYKDHKIRILEDGHLRKVIDLAAPSAPDDLTAVLTMDISGSMADLDRIEQAREAAKVFFKALPARIDCGLILFDHEIKVQVPPQRVQQRSLLLEQVLNTPPDGGTAYFDAVIEAVKMLETAPTRSKAIVLMTDGVDINSRASLEQAIQWAVQAGVRVYAIGIGDPGHNPNVTTVLALDRSGSMLEPAEEGDKGKRKIDALQDAATRFVDIMRSNARATVLEFGDEVVPPGPFTSNKQELHERLHLLDARGETAFLDAAYAAIAALAAENPAGQKAVVVLTDGIDNSSRRRKEEVIERARRAGIPLYLLGLGRPKELDEATLKELAAGTNGQYYHAGNAQALLRAFEKLSIKLHDDGIDEKSLKELALKTGGQYYPAKQIDQLKLILGAVTRDVQQEPYLVKLPSRVQVLDGRQRRISLELMYRDQVVDEKEVNPTVRGLVIAEMNYLLYLAMLAALGILLALPATVRSLLASPKR